MLGCGEELIRLAEDLRPVDAFDPGDSFDADGDRILGAVCAGHDGLGDKIRYCCGDLQALERCLQHQAGVVAH